MKFLPTKSTGLRRAAFSLLAFMLAVIIASELHLQYKRRTQTDEAVLKYMGFVKQEEISGYSLVPPQSQLGVLETRLDLDRDGALDVFKIDIGSETPFRSQAFWNVPKGSAETDASPSWCLAYDLPGECIMHLFKGDSETGFLDRQIRLASFGDVNVYSSYNDYDMDGMVDLFVLYVNGKVGCARVFSQGRSFIVRHVRVGDNDVPCFQIQRDDGRHVWVRFQKNDWAETTPPEKGNREE